MGKSTKDRKPGFLGNLRPNRKGAAASTKSAAPTLERSKPMLPRKRTSHDKSRLAAYEAFPSTFDLMQPQNQRTLTKAHPSTYFESLGNVMAILEGESDGEEEIKAFNIEMTAEDEKMVRTLLDEQLGKTPEVDPQPSKKKNALPPRLRKRHPWERSHVDDEDYAPRHRMSVGDLSKVLKPSVPAQPSNHDLELVMAKYKDSLAKPPTEHHNTAAVPRAARASMAGKHINRKLKFIAVAKTVALMNRMDLGSDNKTGKDGSSSKPTDSKDKETSAALEKPKPFVYVDSSDESESLEVDDDDSDDEPAVVWKSDTIDELEEEEERRRIATIPEEGSGEPTKPPPRKLEKSDGASSNISSLPVRGLQREDGSYDTTLASPGAGQPQTRGGLQRAAPARGLGRAEGTLGNLSTSIPDEKADPDNKQTEAEDTELTLDQIKPISPVRRSRTARRRHSLSSSLGSSTIRSSISSLRRSSIKSVASSVAASVTRRRSSMSGGDPRTSTEDSGDVVSRLLEFDIPPSLANRSMMVSGDISRVVPERGLQRKDDGGFFLAADWSVSSFDDAELDFLDRRPAPAQEPEGSERSQRSERNSITESIIGSRRASDDSLWYLPAVVGAKADPRLSIFRAMNGDDDSDDLYYD